MRLKIRMVLLLCLVLAAAVSAGEAWRSLKPEKGKDIPKELYEQMLENRERAEFYLKNSQGYVAVFKGEREKKPMTVTGIEVSVLRGADRAMLELWIPVADSQELLMLLEDLGS